MEMKAYDAIIDVLDEAGVGTVFTLQSSDVMYMLNSLRDRGDFEVVQSRHEQGAVAMADGYSQASGTIGVCVVGRGPAIAQTGTSLLTARRGGSKVLAIVAESPVAARHDLKAFDQESFLAATMGDVVSIRSHDVLVSEIESVVRRLRVGEGPIAVQVPADLLNGAMEPPNDERRDGVLTPVDAGRPRQPDPERVAEAVDLYLDSDASRPPVVLAGRGAVRADARGPIEDLAERTNAVLTTTLRARGYFSDHPFSLGFAGEWGSSLANDYLLQSDCVFVVGCSLNQRTTDHGHLLRDDAKLIQIDTDPGSVARHAPVDIGILGDARATVTALVEELERRGIDRSGVFWTDRRRERIAETPALDDGEFPDRPDRIDPRDLVESLDDLLPEDRLVVADGGHFMRWVMDAVRTPTPDDLVWPYEFVAIGQGLPAGIGAAAAAEERACVVFCGDAGFMMMLQEVDTAVRNDVPVTIVVGNDRALGSEYHKLDQAGKNAEPSLMETPDLAAVAEGLGAESFTVSGTEDLEELAGVLGERPTGPVVVDCRLNRNVRHRSRM